MLRKSFVVAGLAVLLLLALLPARALAVSFTIAPLGVVHFNFGGASESDASVLPSAGTIEYETPAGSGRWFDLAVPCSGCPGRVFPGDPMRYTNTNGAATSDTFTIGSIKYDITISGGAPSAPTGVLTRDIEFVPQGTTVTFTVVVTPGANPASTGLTVTGDFSALGDSATASFSAAGNTFTYTATVGPSTPIGPKSYSIHIVDAQARSSDITSTSATCGTGVTRNCITVTVNRPPAFYDNTGSRSGSVVNAPAQSIFVSNGSGEVTEITLDVQCVGCGSTVPAQTQLFNDNASSLGAAVGPATSLSAPFNRVLTDIPVSSSP